MGTNGEYPSQFKWIDKNFYHIQFPHGYDEDLPIKKEVWEYFSERVHSIRRIREQLESVTNTISTSIFEHILKMEIRGSKILVDDCMLMHFNSRAILEQHLTADSWRGYTIKSFISPLPTYIPKDVVKSRLSLPENSCIIYFVRSLRNFKNHVKELVMNMKSGQVLIFALVRTLHYEDERVNSMDYMCNFVGHISPLLDRLDVNWCIWYVERERDRYLDLSGMYEWACSEVLLSMNSSKEKETAAQPIMFDGDQVNGYSFVL